MSSLSDFADVSGHRLLARALLLKNNAEFYCRRPERGAVAEHPGNLKGRRAGAYSGKPLGIEPSPTDDVAVVTGPNQLTVDVGSLASVGVGEVRHRRIEP